MPQGDPDGSVCAGTPGVNHASVRPDVFRTVRATFQLDSLLVRLPIVVSASAGALIFGGTAEAQAISINIGTSNGGVSERTIQLISIITVLSVAPSSLVMVTSFTRIAVVLSLLRTAIGTSTAPPNMVVTAFALFLTGFVMWPVLQRSYDEGLRPFVDDQINMELAFERAAEPLRGFMLKNVNEKDLAMFVRLSGEQAQDAPDRTSLRILIPAFMIYELKRSFEIGFLLFLRFLIIDRVVAPVLTAMGIMMLSPTSISSPFKLIFFVLVDGWSLVAGSLVQSYAN
jgi:flagellar biosynthetic protein FliP